MHFKKWVCMHTTQEYIVHGPKQQFIGSPEQQDKTIVAIDEVVNRTETWIAWV